MTCSGRDAFSTGRTDASYWSMRKRVRRYSISSARPETGKSRGHFSTLSPHIKLSRERERGGRGRETEREGERERHRNRKRERERGT